MTQPAASPTSLPVAADVLAAEVVGQFAQAEQQLIDAIARVAARGFRDSTATAQLAMLQAMLSAARSIANQLRMQATPLARRIASIAARDGDQAAIAALRTAVMGDRRLADTYLKAAGGVTGQGLAAANAIAVDLEHSLDATLGGIVRFANDAYRAATAEAATRLVLGRSGLTPLTAQARAWTELVGQGISGYTDSAGRRWNLTSYVEMATRTAVQRAYNAAHLDRMSAVGVDKFTVTDDGHPCPLCKPWQGVVLTRDGARPTIAEATAAGLFHPNCRHTLVAYFPHITRLPEPTPWTPADQARYDATQQLRALEREVRAHKRAALGARTQIDARRADARARAIQARIRAHVERHGLVRRPRREQLNLGNR